MKRIAIFGGTFDPVHSAHLTVAREALLAFALDKVMFIPAANPPHKQASTCADYEHRFRMLELACAGQAGFAASRIEEGRGRSYSILTIERLRADHPQDRFYFLIGADAFAEIETWHRWREVLGSVDFIVASRPGHVYAIPEGARVHRLETVALGVSSTEIREQLARGESPAGVPETVLAYIRENHLYS